MTPITHRATARRESRGDEGKRMRIRATALLFSIWAMSATALAEPGLRDDCRLVLTLDDAFWRYATPEQRGTVALYVERHAGKWVPTLSADAERGLNVAHDGYVVRSSSNVGEQQLCVRLRIRRDRWMDIVGEATYNISFSVENDTCSGTWTGVVHGRESEGKVSGAIKPLHVVKGFVPPEPGEHPRLLIRKQDIPGLREKAETEWGRKLLDGIKGDGSPSAQAFVYALTGDESAAEKAKEQLKEVFHGRGWMCLGGAQHQPAFRAVEQLIAFDMVYDACDDAFRQRIYNQVADKLEMMYWGAYNTQFNGADRSNWSLMFRSAAGLLALTALDQPIETPPAYDREELLHLVPPADLEIGRDVPVVAVDGNPIGSWLYAGPIAEPPNADALGDMSKVRPEAGTAVGDTTFRLITEGEVGEGRDLGSLDVRKGAVNLRKLTGGRHMLGNYLYCVVDVKEPGYYMFDSNRNPKGVRNRKAYLNGIRVEPKEYVRLDAGRYPLMVRVWNEPVGGWEPHVFWCRLIAAEKEEAMAWHLPRAGAVQADAMAGKNWRENVRKQTPWNLKALRHLRQAQHETEGYFTKGLGDHGWNQEGEAYTRHALRVAIPFALCYRNTFGFDMYGAERVGMNMALCTAATVFSDDGAHMQSFNVGGGAMDVDLYARAFCFVPGTYSPAVLWAWNKSLALAAADKLKDPHGIVATHDGLSKVMRFINTPVDLEEKNPGEILAEGDGGRAEGRLCVSQPVEGRGRLRRPALRQQQYAGRDLVIQPRGTFRIDGLGQAWVVRGQSYGNGASARRLKDYSLYQNMVDVKEHDLFPYRCPEAPTTFFQSAEDGSGIVSLNMDEVYIGFEKVKKDKRRRRVDKDLGIRAVRSLAVDYSGTSGAPCLVAVADRLTGTQGDNTWQMALPREMAVAINGNTFVATAKSGETLHGTVVLPERTEVSTADYEHTHELNYHGNHNQGVFKRRAVLVKGSDKDQDFLVVMTIQRGDAPPCRAQEGRASIGGQTVSFDGKRVRLGTLQAAKEATE